MNRKGLADFLRLAWPRVRREVPEAELMLAGDICETLGFEVPGISRLGRVSDLAPLYRDARLVINPAIAGTGVKIKTLEALGNYRTVLTWPSGVDGIASELAALCAVVHDWYAFGQQLCSLLTDDPPPSFTSDQRETIRRCMAPETTYRALTEALETLMDERWRTDTQPGTPRALLRV